MANCAYFVKFTPPRAFDVSFFILYRFVTDILNMCTKKFNDEEVLFFIN